MSRAAAERVADRGARFLGRVHALAPAARADFVDPGIFHDAEHPAVQPRAGPPLRGAGQGFFHGHLHQVVRIGDVARDDAGEAPQPRQQLPELRADLIGLRRRAHDVKRPAGPVSSRGMKRKA